MLLKRIIKFYAKCFLATISMLGVSAHAEDLQIHSAGKVTFALGKAYINGSDSVVVGTQVEQGDVIETLGNGHVHIRFVDDGLVSVRPDSKLSIEQYQYNEQHPSDSVIKFVLEEGVMRSISGHGAKAARDKFRLNTPIAAIGVRGTDFVVKASNNLIQAVVNEGAIVVAPFSTQCDMNALGPCANAVELNSASKKLLELSSLYETPRLLPLSSNLSSDLISEQEASLSESDAATDSDTAEDEALASEEAPAAAQDDNADTGTSNTDPSSDDNLPATSDVDESENSVDQADTVSSSASTDELSSDSSSSYFSNTGDANETSHDERSLKSLIVEGVSDAEIKNIIGERVAADRVADANLTNSMPSDGRKLAWGRFDSSSSNAPRDDSVVYGNIFDAARGRQLEPTSIISSRDYKHVAALFRSSSELDHLDTSLGNVKFDLTASQASLYKNDGSLESLDVSNGLLEVDFSSGYFNTRITVGNENLTDTNLFSRGRVNPITGEFESNQSNGYLKGATTLEGDEASYIIYRDIDAGVIEGATYWRNK